MFWYVRRGGCKWCGYPITMVRVGYDKWLAFEGFFRWHDCPMRPDRPMRKSEGWGSYAWRRATSEMRTRDFVGAIAFCVVAVFLLAVVLRFR